MKPSSLVIDELSNETSFTFKVDDVEPNPEEKLTFLSPEEAFRRQGDCKTAVKSFSHAHDKTTKILYPQMNGFMNAIHHAYSNHRPLRLSVSDFIFMIGQGIAKHMEIHAEDLRSHFVDFKGKERIEILRGGGTGREDEDPNDPWVSIFAEFGEKIRERVKTDLYDVIVDDTSVSTKLTKIASEITILDAFQHYFEYVVRLICGIPKITLVGRPDDWEKLRTKVTKLQKLNEGDRLQLDWWLEKLVPVVNKLVDQAVSREIDREFWQNIYKWQEGGGIYNPIPNISGWVTVFNPYIVNAKKAPIRSNLKDLLPKDLITGISVVPFKLIDITGTEHPMLFYGGFLGAQIAEDGAVEPVYFYAVAQEKVKEEDKKSL